MNIALDILIVGTATAAGFATGWMTRAERRSADTEGSGKWREQALHYKEQILVALNETATARHQAALAKSEAATHKLEAAQIRRDLEDAREESSRAHEALSRLQLLAASIADDVDQHSSRVQAISAELEQDGGGASAVVAAVAQLIQANAQMQQQLETAEEKLKHQAEELQTHITEARTDALTGLYNRRAFDRELTLLQDRFQSDGEPSCVMMVDVDFFKKFNDTFGHQAGDEVLRGVARVLKASVDEAAIVCRYGGEEFAVIFPRRDLAAARPIAERARAAIADATFEFEGTPLRVTASGGVAQFLQEETAEEMVKRADDALYVCKEAGRNCGHYHDGQTVLPMTERLLEANTNTHAASGHRDELTGLSSQQALLDDLERRLAEWRRGGTDISLLMVEIDKFERLIKAFGEAAGDTILKATAQFLKASMREMDHVARWDERRFALLLPGATKDVVCGIAERLRSAIDNCKLPVGDAFVQFTISVGISAVMTGDTSETLLERVDQLVKDASEQGGNRSLIAETDMETSAAAAAR